MSEPVLPTPIRLPAQPLDAAEPVQHRRDSGESRREFARVLGTTRRAHAGDQAAVVEFGAAALGLARRGAPADDGVEAEAEGAPEGESTARGGAGRRAPDGAASEDERREIDRLGQRDREVRMHEQAHARAGGAHAGNMRLSYEVGPNGKRYAAEGSVPIDVTPVTGDPAATLRKMEIVVRAAMAPQSPSGEDRAVAAQARSLGQQARAKLAADRYAQAQALFPSG